MKHTIFSRLVAALFCFARRGAGAFLVILGALNVVGQVPVADEAVENLILQNEGEGDFDFEMQFEHLDRYARNPLNLNTATAETLTDFGLLSPIQVQQLLWYRQQQGGLIAMEELQAVPDFDMATIRRILPYTEVGGEATDVQLRLGQLFRAGSNDLYLHGYRTLEKAEGYKAVLAADSTLRPAYGGDPNLFFIRFRHNTGTTLSYGFTMEKDAGEPLNRQSKGFDYYSAHVYLRDYNRWLKDLAIGDYEIKLGQGLAIWTGFATRKGAWTTDIKRGGRQVRGYTSVNESNFLRGVAATFQPVKRLRLTFFGSHRPQDANVSESDTSEVPSEISSLGFAGLHRTEAERADRHAIRLTTAGGSASYVFERGEVGINAVYNLLSAPFERTPALYNQFYFSGDRLLNASVHYTYYWGSWHFFGETAWSDNGAVATLNGVLFNPDRAFHVGLLHRHYDRAYQTLLGNAFAETNGVVNETGFYMGFEYAPNRRWNASFYADAWKHPWLRYGVDAPSGGGEYLFQVSHTPTKTSQFYVRLRYEGKETNRPNAEGIAEPKLDVLALQRRLQVRLHAAYQIAPSLELRTRAEWSRYEVAGSAVSSAGFLVYQDVLYSVPMQPLAFNFRYALFDTEDYNSRIYAYENSLLYTFAIPAYYYQGNRFYFNIRYRPVSALTLEGRFAQSVFSNRRSIGSGLNTIEGNRRSEVRFQVRYSF